MRRPDNKTLILTGILLVVVVLLTCLLRFDIHHQEKLAGYWTLGDVGVYIAAALLPGPWAALAAKRILTVAAAGNSGDGGATQGVSSFAADPNQICVSATTGSGDRCTELAECGGDRANAAGDL